MTKPILNGASPWRRNNRLSPLRQPKKPDNTTESWWLGKGRAELQRQASEEQARMARSKESGWVNGLVRDQG